MAADSLAVATDHYHWKPGKAFFHSFELEEYGRAGLEIEHPLLDLGCADGTFASMLRERGVVDFVDFGLEYASQGLRSARERMRSGALRGDARALPVRSGALRTVVANGVLCSVESDVERAISEVHRVLAERGQFVLTVPTDRVNETQLIPNALRRAGFPGLAARYLARLNRRCIVFHTLDEAAWRERLREGRFRIEQVRYFFTPRQAFWTNLLAFHVFRVFAVSKALRVRALQRALSRLQERSFRRIFAREQAVEQRDKRASAAYLLIVARKAEADGAAGGRGA